ncbi:transposase [Salinibacter ruber]|nr:transposase [Salinibacter ruber]
MIREQTVWKLDSWLSSCSRSGIERFDTFAAGLRQDYAAVRAALSEPWSNGQAEGQINRLKMIKRQMYGRASFNLLRKRVLYRA